MVSARRWRGSTEEGTRQSRSEKATGRGLEAGEPAGEDGEGRALHPESCHVPRYGALTAKSRGGRGVWHSIW